jgi:hypothetical protein
MSIVPELEHVPLSSDLLRVMRDAANRALDLKEPFITPRTILLALLDEPSVGPAIAAVVNKEKVLEAKAEDSPGMNKLLEDRMEAGEQPAMMRYDTLAFKTPDGRASMWLNQEAYAVFVEGARRVEERYEPKHLALGFAAQAITAPGLLTKMRVEPGVLADAIYKL